MKKLILSLILFSFAYPCYAETLFFEPPAGTASYNGTIKSNVAVLNIYEVGADKTLEINRLPDGSIKYIVYGLNNIEQIGGIRIEIADKNSYEFDMRQVVCASADARPIKCNGYYKKKSLYRGITTITEKI